jgi:hypothetical protein
MMNKKQIEEMTCSRDFVTAAIFPAGMIGEIGAISSGFRILEVGGRDDLFELLKRELPQVSVVRQKEGEPGEKGFFDYIAAVGLKYLPCGEETDRFFRELVALLKPGGVMSAHVCSFSGYYGVVMLGAIIRQLSRGQNLAATLKIAQAIIQELPETHPAFACEILKSHVEISVKELLELSTAIADVDKLYTVSKLMEAIPRWGGRFLRWVFPPLYDPTSRFQSNGHGLLRRLNALPEPRRSIAAELLTASPPGHYFLVQKF